MVTSEEVRYFLCWCRWCVDVNVRGKRNGAECWGGVVLIPPLSLLEDLEDLEDFSRPLLLLLLDPFPLLFDSNRMLRKLRLCATLERRSARPSLFSERVMPLFLCSLLAIAFWDSVDTDRAITNTDCMRYMFA